MEPIALSLAIFIMIINCGLCLLLAHYIKARIYIAMIREGYDNKFTESTHNRLNIVLNKYPLMFV